MRVVDKAAGKMTAIITENGFKKHYGGPFLEFEEILPIKCELEEKKVVYSFDPTALKRLHEKFARQSILYPDESASLEASVPSCRQSG